MQIHIFISATEVMERNRTFVSCTILYNVNIIASTKYIYMYVHISYVIYFCT